MQLPSFPVLRLRIKPHFDSSGAASRFSVTYTIQSPCSDPSSQTQDEGDSKLPQGDLRFSFQTFGGNVPYHQYKPEDIHASDDYGRLPILFSPKQGDPDAQIWHTPKGRRVLGDVTLRMDVWPRKVNANTPLGARIDLRKDQGGLMGAGSWFLPRLLTEQVMFTNIAEWDLSLAPKGTRAVWSHGEGPQPVVMAGPVDTLINTVYMVGPIQSFPPEPQRGTSPGFSACYWFAKTLPSNLDRLKSFNSDMFLPMARMFEGDGEKDDYVRSSYRVFMRKSERGYGGTGFRESYVLEYDDRVAQEDEEELKELFAHEMVHSFALMDQEEDGDENGWYIEGIAEFYGCVLPTRFGILPATYLTTRFNNKLSAYFTNPAITMSLADAQRLFFETWYAEHVAYHRGFAYLLLVDAQLRTAAGVDDPLSPGPLDEIAVSYSKMRAKGEKILQKNWLCDLGKWLDGSGVDYKGQFQAMTTGESPVALGGSYVLGPMNPLEETRQRELQFGFDRNSVRTLKVGEVEADSNAEKAGLRHGMEIVDYMRGGDVVQHPEATYWLKVREEEGDGEDEGRKIEWLPRAEKEVPVQQMGSFKQK